MTPGEAREFSKMRERVEILELENERLREMLAPPNAMRTTLGLSPIQADLLKALVVRRHTTIDDLHASVYAMREDSDAEVGSMRQQIFKLRKKLTRFGVKIGSRSHHGYWLEPADLAKLRELGAL